MMSEKEIKKEILPELRYQIWLNTKYSWAYEKVLFYVEKILYGSPKGDNSDDLYEARKNEGYYEGAF